MSPNISEVQNSIPQYIYKVDRKNKCTFFKIFVALHKTEFIQQMS